MTTKSFFAILLAIVFAITPVIVLAKSEGYEFSETYLSEGTAEYLLDAEYKYTVFTLEPSEVGIYTVSVADGLLGIVSLNGMWITVDPSPESVKESSVTWKCSSVGQSIMIAVLSDGETASITVSKEELIVVEIPVTEYQNKATLTPFEYDGSVDDFDYVDIDDDFIDTAVLGTDGYYHLNSAKGPILYACLTDSVLSLAGAMSYGQLKEMITENGVIVEKIDYNAAVEEYLEYADDDGFYPLTEDLITILKGAGKQLGWYGEGGWLGCDNEDAWMYFCYYNPADVPAEILGDVDGDGTVSEADVTLLMSILVGNTEADELFDFDSDGELTIYDCVWLMQQIG